MPTKIIQIIPQPEGGGAELLVRELAKRLFKQGINSKTLYFAEFDKSSKNQLRSNEYSLGMNNPRNIISIFKIRKFLINELQNEHDVILHAHLTWAFLFVPLASIGLKLRLFYTEHDTYNKRRNYKIFRFIDSIFYKKYKKIFCISKGVKDNLEHWLKGSIETEVIYNGARKFDFYPRKIPKNKKINILSIGSLIPKKGFDFAIGVISEIREFVNKYIILGEGSERKNLQKIIDQLELSEIVTLEGWSDSLQKKFNHAHLQLIPSRYEGFGLVAVEGMSSGLPVIASDLPGLDEVIKNHENLTSRLPMQAELWCEEIIKFTQLSEEKYKKISFDNHIQAKNFTLDKMVTRYLEYYKSYS